MCTCLFGHPGILSCLRYKLQVLQYPTLQKYIRSGLHIGSGCGPPELICHIFILSVFLYFVTITVVVDSSFYNFLFFILTQGPLGWEY